MLYVLTFKTRSLNAGSIPWFVGHETRAGFLDLVKRGDKELAETLHNTPGLYTLRALTLTSGSRVVWRKKTRIPGYGIIRPMDAGILYTEGARGWFQVTIYKPDLLTRLITALSHGIRAPVKIRTMELAIEELNMEAVDTNRIISEAQPVQALDIYFKSPTYFNPPGGADYKIIYPHPPSLITSLQKTLQQTQNNLELQGTEETLFLSGIDIRTPANKPGETPTPQGFLGWTRLRLDNLAQEQQKQLHAALKIAEHTGVGGNRTAGYGEIEVKEPGRETSHH